MGYVGNQTTNSYSSMDKQTITGNGGASYTLTHSVANAQEIEVFVNNVRQEPGVAYTVSGTALSMTGNVASTDDFYVIYQGKALQTTVPPDDSVTTARINDGAVTTAKLGANAVTSAKMFSGFFNGISHFDMYHMDTAESIGGSFEYLNHWASFDGVKNFNRIGAAMTVTSQTAFAFPVTGTWKVVSNLAVHTSTDIRYFQHEIRLSTNSASSYDAFDHYDAIPYLQSGVTYHQSYRERYINVTNTSTFRVAIGVVASGTCNVQGNNTTSKHLSLLSFMRIGDAQ